MELNIYADVLFITNFIADYLLIMLSGKFCGFQKNRKFYLLSAAIGGIYALSVFFISPRIVYSVLLKISIGLLMVYIAYRPKKLKFFLRSCCIFFAVSFAFGGMAYALLFFGGSGARLGAVRSGGVTYVNIPVYKMLFVFLTGYAVLKLAFSASHKASARASLIFDAHIEHSGREVSLRLLYDSGNMLTVSSAAIGVCVVSWDSIKALFDTNLPFSEYRQKNNCFLAIPCSGIDGFGIIYGFSPQIITVAGKDEKMYVGISEMNFGGEYDGILPQNIDIGKE